MTGSRGEAAVVILGGLAAMAAFWWFPYRALLIAGAATAALGVVALGAALRHSRAWHEQDILMRKLWAAVKRIPPGRVLEDPDTGELLRAERERGWLTLAVTDPSDSGAETIVTRYLLGRWATPLPPPLYQHMAGPDDVSPARWPLRQHAQLADFNAATEALKVTTGELATLHAQVRRALTCAVPPHSS